MRILRCAAIACAVAIGAKAQVSMLVADKGALVGSETINPSPQPKPADAATAVVAVGQVAVQEPIQLAPPPKVTSEPYVAPAPAPAASVAAAPAADVFQEAVVPSNVKVHTADSTGVIVLPRRQSQDGKNAPTPELISQHNPWGVRVVTKETLLSFTLRLDGIIVGTNPTALINTVPVQQGQTKTGPFTLYGIRRQEVLMAYDGTLFELPLGRTITVRIPKL